MIILQSQCFALSCVKSHLPALYNEFSIAGGSTAAQMDLALTECVSVVMILQARIVRLTWKQS